MNEYIQSIPLKIMENNYSIKSYQPHVQLKKTKSTHDNIE